MRTPLNAMIGVSENLNSHITNKQGKEFLSIIKTSSMFLLFLVNDLLDFFQIKNGKFRKNEEVANIKSSLISVLDMFRF